MVPLLRGAFIAWSPYCMVPSDFCLPPAELAVASLDEMKELSGYLIDTIMKGANNAVHEGS